MSTSTLATIDRRRFLAMAGVAGMAGVTLSTLPLGFSKAAAAQTGPRSLVCIFLAGGADSANMFIPFDHGQAGKTHDVYRATRGDFSVARSAITPIYDGQFGVNAGLPGLADLANDDRVAVVQNVGPLARPTTRSDFEADRSVPQLLFAHDAQQKLWQTARPTLTTSQGWGGALSAAVSGGAEVAPSFSIDGSNIWQSATDGPYIRLSPTVPIELLKGYDASTRRWIPSFEGVESVLQRSLQYAGASTSPFERAIASSIGDAIVTTEQLQAATADSAANDVGMDDIGGNRLGMQLEQVARLIRNRQDLNMDRQVFFVRMGGWDTHGQQALRFPALLRELDTALASFQRALDGLGVADSVTTFTASDFGRTLTSNGDGTDHGWGGHAFVIGGAVKPGRYGTFPNYATINNPDDTGDRRRDFAGRLIPTTSVSQYGATLARWMGLSSPELDEVFPELSNFSIRDLGFLRS